MKFEIENQWLLIAKKNRKVAASFWLLEQPRPLFAAAQAPGGVRCGAMCDGAVVKWRRYPGCCRVSLLHLLLQIVYGLTNAISIMYVIHSCSQTAV